MYQSRYADEGFSALDIPTSAALEYVREHAAATRRASIDSRSAKVATEAARLLIVVDAGCDMPTAWLHNHSVAVVPVDIKHGSQTLRDVRDETQCGEFAHLLRHAKMPVLEAEPLMPPEIRDHLQSWMSPTVDFVLQLTFSASRSRLHMSSLAATQSLVLIHNKVRRSMPGRGPLKAWVIDTQNGLSGMAVLLAYAVQLRERGVDAAQIAPAVQLMRDKLHTLLVPGDLRYLSQTAQRKGGSGAFPRWKAVLGRVLNISPVLYAGAGDVHALARFRGYEKACNAALARAQRHVELGLASTAVCVSYAGDLEALVTMPAYDALSHECKRRNVDLICSVMSMTGCLKLGPGALAVSFASERFLAT